MKITQCEMIEDYINEYGSISALEALRDLGVYRLASRICQMKKSGLNIKSEMVSVATRNGGRTHIARYSWADDNVNLTERNVQMVESKVYLQRVTEPKIGGKIYFQFIKTTRTLEPCIVESGEYLDSNFGRLSNFWYWMNLRTGKREHGYGCFYEMVEILENDKQEQPPTVANPDTPTTSCEKCAKKSSCKLQNKVHFSELMPKMIVCDEFTPTDKGEENGNS